MRERKSERVGSGRDGGWPAASRLRRPGVEPAVEGIEVGGEVGINMTEREREREVNQIEICVKWCVPCLFHE